MTIENDRRTHLIARSKVDELDAIITTCPDGLDPNGSIAPKELVIAVRQQIVDSPTDFEAGLL